MYHRYNVLLILLTYTNVEGLEVIIEPKNQLEINFSIYEGVHRDDDTWFLLLINMNLTADPNVKSFIELCKRVYEFLDKIKEQATKSNVFISVS